MEKNMNPAIESDVQLVKNDVETENIQENNSNNFEESKQGNIDKPITIESECAINEQVVPVVVEITIVEDIVTVEENSDLVIVSETLKENTNETMQKSECLSVPVDVSKEHLKSSINDIDFKPTETVVSVVQIPVVVISEKQDISTDLVSKEDTEMKSEPQITIEETVKSMEEEEGKRNLKRKGTHK